MYFQRFPGRFGPTETQPGSSRNASARTRAAPSCWTGVSGSGSFISGKRRCVRLRPLGAEDQVATRQPLELELPPLVEAQAVAVATRSRGAQLLGDQDLTAHGLRRDSRRQDHVLAEVVALLGDHLARVESDPNAERLPGAVALALRERALDLDRALERLARIGEGEHEAVALALHLVALVARDLLPEDRVVLTQHPQPLLVAELLGEDGRVLDVAEQDRDRPIGRGVRAHVGPLLLQSRDHLVDRGRHVDAREPLRVEAVAQ